MLYLDYAKQTENGYIMNFFANSVEDLEDISEGKEFVTKNGTNYGVPAPQSVVTITNKDGEKTTYLMGEDGNWIPGVVNPTDYYTKKQTDAKLEGKEDKITDINLTETGTTVEYSLADGITLNSTARLTSNEKTHDATMKLELPLVVPSQAGSPIVMDKAENSEKVELRWNTGASVKVGDLTTTSGEVVINGKPTEDDDKEYITFNLSNGRKYSIREGSGESVGNWYIRLPKMEGSLGDSLVTRAQAIHLAIDETYTPHYKVLQGTSGTITSFGPEPSYPTNYTIGVMPAGASGIESYTYYNPVSFDKSSYPFSISYNNLAVSNDTLKVSELKFVENDWTTTETKEYPLKESFTGVTIYDSNFSPIGKVDGIMVAGAYPEPSIITGTTTLSMPQPITKTLFGNQSIYGTGNIDLYRHNVQIRQGTTGSENYIYTNLYSSKNTPIDSITDLKTMLDLSAGETWPAYGTVSDGQPALYLRAVGANLAVAYMTGSLTTQTLSSGVVTDTVKAI